MPTPAPLAVPTLHRRIPIVSLPDADWAGTQVPPPAAVLGDAAGLSGVAFWYVGRDAAGAVVAGGSLDLQLVASSGAMVSAVGPVTANTPQGHEVTRAITYVGMRPRLMVVRVVDVSTLSVGTTHVEIYWRAHDGAAEA